MLIEWVGYLQLLLGTSTFTWNKYADMLTKEAAQEAKEKVKLPPVISMGDVKEVQVCQMAGDVRVRHSFFLDSVVYWNSITLLSHSPH